MNKTRVLLFVLSIVILAASLFSFVFLETHFLIRKWNIPLSVGGFIDARQIGVAAESYAKGYDPMKENLFDSEGYKGLNYPRIWHVLFHTGIDRTHTNLLGTIFAILFFIGVGLFWFYRKYDSLTYLVLSLVVLSPPVMLGIERGNVEVVIFFVLAVALFLYYYSNILGMLFFLFAAILKLYPVFAFLALLKDQKRKCLTLLIPACTMFIVYVLFSLDDLKQIAAIQPMNSKSSYGLNVFWMGLTHPRLMNLQIADNVIMIFKTFSYTALIFIFAGAWICSVKYYTESNYNHGKYLDSFRAGAGIYIGCFLLGNNYDYRLIFLIFTIPQLVTWLRDNKKDISFVPLLTIIAMLFSLWSYFIAARFLGQKLTFLLEEFTNWIMLTTLLYLFLASVPNWVNDYLRRPLSKIINFDRHFIANR